MPSLKEIPRPPAYTAEAVVTGRPPGSPHMIRISDHGLISEMINMTDIFRALMAFFA